MIFFSYLCDDEKHVSMYMRQGINIAAVAMLCACMCMPMAAQPEVVKQRLSRLPNVIETPYNEVVQKSIDAYLAEQQKSRVAEMLGRMNLWVETFEEVLEAEELPLELRFLPVVESGLDATATGASGTAGLWQMSVAAAKEQGLEVTSVVDERRDPLKSTQAAAKRLKALHSELGDWTLAITAYKAGLPTVTKAMQRAGGVKDFWRLYPYLPEGARSYVPSWIAAEYMMTYYCEYGIASAAPVMPQRTDTVQARHKMALGQVSAVCGIPMDTLEMLNPQYRAGIVPEGYSLRLPMDKLSVYVDAEERVHLHEPEKWLTMREETVVSKTPATTTRNTYRRRRTRRR